MASRPRAAILGGAGPLAWLPLVVCAIAGLAQALGDAAAIGTGLGCFLAGLAHGAGDENGGRIAPYRLYHALAYLLSGAALAALFLFAPLAGLSIFLLLSAWHVGRSERGGAARDWAVAALLIGGSALFRPDATSEVFASLLGQPVPAAFMLALAAIGVAGCALVFVSLWRKDSGWPRAALCVPVALAFHPVLAAGIIFLNGHAMPVQCRQIAAYGWQATCNAVRWPLGLSLAGATVLAIVSLHGLVALPLVAALAFGLATPHMLTERIEP